ncbi:carboxypeptidase regulatory-like domain-containing protein [Candidatus Woesearchaeota archaeon]|nr:carboxypeptidase regulatory-like domain-containing protein [Candidatus Woesearchaeota archaeon]
MKKKWLLIIFTFVVIISAVIILNSCSLLTGRAVDATTVLEVKVVDDSGALVCEAEVYVNNIFKGNTRCFGETKGIREVILSEKNNTITVKKQNYLPSKVNVISKSDAQQITVRLAPQKAIYTISVTDEFGILTGASVVLYQDGKALKGKTTDSQGNAIFEGIEAGNYVVEVSKEGYRKMSAERAIFSVNNDWSSSISLNALPQLKIKVTTNNQNVAEVEVSLYSKVEYNSPAAVPLHIKYSDANGQVFFDDVGDHTNYVLVIKKENYLAKVVETYAEEGSSDIYVKLESS